MDPKDFIEYYTQETNRRLVSIETMLTQLLEERASLLGQVRLITFLTSTLISVAGVVISIYIKG